MSIQLLIDMNLSPDWVDFLSSQGWQTVHWSTIGKSNATDIEVLDWARKNDHVVLTHDLDFGTMLALSHKAGPSVLQIRTQDVLPDHLSSILLAALQQHETDLASGALVVVDESKTRVRVLPI
ncbi:MAG: DUF5615 family PIN-like protein [Pirellulales bacterium]|nr:DUF5615 family PIN-like protein [Pirellulales bacterium]